MTLPAAPPRVRQSGSGISLAHLKFLRRHEHELRVFWHLSAAVEYAARWWNTIGQSAWPRTIAGFPGDQRAPFSFVDLAPSEYLGHGGGVLRSLAENTLVSLVTVFEVYMFDAVQRTVFLDPSSVEDSDVTIRAGDLARHMARPAPQAWFARAMADRYCRNKSHADLIKRVGRMVKSDIVKSNDGECSEWYRWVLVRNSIVHLGGEVSTDLVAAWPSKFPSAGTRLEIRGPDVSRVAYIARTLVSALDGRLVHEVVRDEDKMLLARELFIRYGIAQPSTLAQRVSQVLGCRFSKNNAEQAISDQKRGTQPESGFAISEEMLAERVL